jgi:hypothetical protein
MPACSISIIPAPSQKVVFIMSNTSHTSIQSNLLQVTATAWGLLVNGSAGSQRRRAPSQITRRLGFAISY